MATKKKVAFGGYSINFKGCSDSLEEIMGDKPIGPSEMTKKIWAYVKRKRLAKK
jgi:chromatin remodeling complex protein RSC6